ncbi:MAG: MBL fold metallo-hydrolase [Fibrobacterota bacterium]
MKILFLGTGSSSGTPVPGCGCRVCRSPLKRNRRLRPALLIEQGGKRLLIDTPPELRLQLVEHDIDRVDALLYTHCHADHVYGLDDVRFFSRKRKLPVYGDARTLAEIRCIFPYVFKKTARAGGKPRLRMRVVDRPFRWQGLRITPVPVFHGKRKVLGYRINAIAYIPDCSRIPASSFRLLSRLSILILDALRETPHPTHFSLAESLTVASKIGARRTLLTHISHSMDYISVEKRLPRSVRLAYDGFSAAVKKERLP